MEDPVDAAFFRDQAAKCLRLADSVNDEEAIAALRNMAMTYEIRARRLDEQALNGKSHPESKLPPQT